MRMLQSIKDILKRPYYFFFSILLFFTPLIFTGDTNELFEFPKMFFLYFFGFFIICFFLSDVLVKPAKLKIPGRFILIFFTLILISTVLSSHFYTSFFGYYTRFNGGFLSYVLFLGLYFVAMNKLDKTDLEKIFRVSLFTIVPISLFGLSQYFAGNPRVSSTLGQPNWLAQYLSMILSPLIYIMLTEDSKGFKMWFGVYAVGFFCLWVTYSMSGILGFVVSLFIVFTKFRKNKSRVGDFKLRLVLIALISLFISITNLGLYREKVEDIFVDLRKQAYLVRRAYAQVEENKLSDPGFIRMEIWKGTLRLIFSNPKLFLIGSGPETFPYVFQPFRPEKLNYSSEWDFVFNKPHNYYLEIWSESGFFPLVVFLAILYHLFKKTEDIFTPLVGGFSATLFFGWPVAATSLLFWFVLSSLDSSNKKNFELKIFKIAKLLVAVIWVFYFFFVYFLGRYYFADVNFKKSQDLIGAGFEDEALYYANKSISLNPLEPNYYRGRAKILTVFLVSSEGSERVKEEILEDLIKAQSLNPENLVTIRNSIPIYYFLAVEDVFLSPGAENVDEKYSTLVKEFYQNVKKDYWSDVGVILSIAKYEKRLGFDKGYEASLKRIEELRPDILEWHESIR